MKIKEPCTKKCLAVFALVFLCQYAIEHVAYVVTDAAYSGAIYLTAPALSAIRQAVGYIVDAIEICSIAAAALIIMLRFVNSGVLRALPLAGAVLATKLVYVVPHYYMSTISYGYDSAESLLLGLLFSLATLISLLIELGAAIALGSLPAILHSRREGGEPCELLADGLSRRELLDVGNFGTAAMLIASAVLCAKSLVQAVIDTVAFFSAYGSSYSFGDVLFVMFGLIYPLILIFAAYLVMQLIKSGIMRSAPSEEADKNECEIE